MGENTGKLGEIEEIFLSCSPRVERLEWTLGGHLYFRLDIILFECSTVVVSLYRPIFIINSYTYIKIPSKIVLKIVRMLKMWDSPLCP